MSRPGYGGGDLPAVFPDWSPYQDLESAARAYLRDVPDARLVLLDAGHFAVEEQPVAIAKEIVEAHHGTISVDSTPGVGTTFSITLPARVLTSRRITPPRLVPESVG